MTLNFFEGGGRGWSLVGRPFSFELNILGERVELLSEPAVRFSITWG